MTRSVDSRRRIELGSRDEARGIEIAIPIIDKGVFDEVEHEESLSDAFFLKVYPESVPSSDQKAKRLLYEAECAYRTGNFEMARSCASQLVKSDDRIIVMCAHATRMGANVALGEAGKAYDDYAALRDYCETGFARADDPTYYEASVLLALRIEGMLMGKVFDIPQLRLDQTPLSQSRESIIGFLMAQRAMRAGRPERAAGIAEAFLMICKHRSAFSSVLLLLAIASADMMSGNPEGAERAFVRAWMLAKSEGIVMPFVEHNFMLLGLPRRCSLTKESGEYRRLESMVKTYHDGWFGLRKLCGLDSTIESLTPLESYVSGLVVLGWRNGEVASHLQISENTVKHQLTTVYQKLGVGSRTELRQMWHNRIERGLLV